MTRVPTSARRLGRATLFAGTGAAALMLAAGQAQAQVHPNDACGAPVDGVVTCASGNAYADGVWYGGEMTEPLTIRLENDVAIAPIDFRAGLHAVTQNAAITFDGPGASVSTRNADAVAAYVEGVGDISIRLGEVSTVSEDGTGARGIVAGNDAGVIVIDVDRVSTVGDYATGIRADSLIGDISVRAGEVSTNGNFSEGIAVSTGGAITIDAGSVTTNGELALGILAQGGLGPISITADTINTTGFAADGVTVAGAGVINVQVNAIRGSGDYVWGVNAANGGVDELGNIYSDRTFIRVGTIDLTGYGALGVNLESYSSGVVVIDDLRIDGDAGVGVNVVGVDYAEATVGNASFTGAGTGGINVQSFNNAYANVGSLYSESGAGVLVQGVYGYAVAEVGSADIGADYGHAVALGSAGGPVTAGVGSVVTRGVASDGVHMEAFTGRASLNLGSASTVGDTSRGVYVLSGEAAVVVSGPVSTVGNWAEGLLVASLHGDASVVATGPVSTAGDNSSAFWVTGRYGTADVRSIGAVTTEGGGSHGIWAEAESGQMRVSANTIETSGAGADGVRARSRYFEFSVGGPSPNPPAFTSDIDIRANRVTVTGAGANAISARGLGDARILVGEATAADGYAIEANMIGDVALDLRGLARSATGSAIRAQGEHLNLILGSGSRVEGAVDGLILVAGARCVLPNPEDGVSMNPCPNPGYDQPDFQQPYPLQPIELGGTARVDNAGVIVAGTGQAVRLTDGALDLRNSGRIFGSITTAGADDRFANAGLWEIGKDSDFGAGDDRLSNTGVVRFAAATAPVAITLRNLERFENAGLVDLRNGAVGDSLTVSGDFVGQAGSVVGLDIDLAEGRADRIVIGGAATGTTLLRFDGDYSTATLGDAAGIVVVQAGAGSSETAFALAPDAARASFVGHSLDYDETTRRFLLHSAASEAAWRQLGVTQALEGVSTAGFDLWRSQTTLTRDTAFAGEPAEGFWFALQGGESSRDWNAASGGGAELDLDYRQDRSGAQVGYEVSVSPTLRAGVTGGYGQSTLEYDASGDTFEVSGFNLGGHISAVRGAAFGSARVKYDLHEIEIASTALAQDAEVDGSSWGADLEAGYRFGGPTLFLEPLAGVRWTSASADDLVNGIQRIAYEDGEDLVARAGFRLGGGQALAGGSHLSFHGGVSVLHSTGDDHAVVLTAGESERLTAERVGTWGQGVFGVTWRTGAGLETFAEGQGDLGSDYDAFAGRVGLRLRF